MYKGDIAVLLPIGKSGRNTASIKKFLRGSR